MPSRLRWPSDQICAVTPPFSAKGLSAGTLPSGFRRITLPRFLAMRSEEHTSELQSLMRISYAVFCLKKKNQLQQHKIHTIHITRQQTNKYTMNITYRTHNNN